MSLLWSNVIDFAHIINFGLEPQKQRAQQMRSKDGIYNFRFSAATSLYLRLGLNLYSKLFAFPNYFTNLCIGYS